MQITEKNINDLTTYKNNAKKHDSDQIQHVANSIERFGFVQPLVIDRNGEIVIGHCRYAAAKKLNLKTVPCVIADTLTEQELKALRLADNKTNESLWDDELLDMELYGIFELNMEDFGFDLNFEDEEPEAQEDDFDGELPEEPKAKRGGIYQLGRHRLMCGDSTSTEDVAVLMNGVKADMVFTDPPYALFGNSTGVSGVGDDKMISPFFREIGNQIKRNLKPMGHAYICCDWQTSSTIQQCVPLVPKNLIVWRKAEAGGLGSYYTKIYELIWLFVNELEKGIMGKNKIKARTINGTANIWDFPIVQSKDRVHNAQKPVEVVSVALKNSCDEGENVLDLFGSSGSTLIACEQLNRVCYMMELEPKYVDVIIERWEKLAGGKAVLLNGDTE